MHAMARAFPDPSRWVARRKGFFRGFVDRIVPCGRSPVTEALLQAAPHLVQYLGMGAREVALKVILDLEHACADRSGDRFADMIVKRPSGRGPVQLQRSFNGELDLLWRDGILQFGGRMLTSNAASPVLFRV